MKSFPVATESRSLKTESGETIAVRVPVGRIEEPADDVKRLFDLMKDPRGWKYALTPFETADLALARRLAKCIDHYVGGHEFAKVGDRYRVSSKGYYHYVGA